MPTDLVQPVLVTAITVLLTQLVKPLVSNSKLYPPIACLIGILLAFLVYPFSVDAIGSIVLRGVFSGVAAMGAYAGPKALTTASEPAA